MARGLHAAAWTSVVVFVLALLAPEWAGAQIVIDDPNQVSGVMIDADGVVKARKTAPAAAIRVLRERANAARDNDGKVGPLAYVSLPRLLERVAECAEKEQPLPLKERCLGGMTQLQYVFVFPDQKDLVIAGPAEEIDDSNPLQPIGKTTGRPVLQFDDLIVAVRTMSDRRGRHLFGCSIDPTPDVLERSAAVVRRYQHRGRSVLMRKLTESVGPQKVRVMGTAADTRLAFIMVAADFQLKRMFLGLEKSPVAPIGNSVGAQGTAGNRYWFEADYKPLLVSEDGNTYALRGQRLKVLAGETSFKPGGATQKAEKFAADCTEHMTTLAATMPLFADLQNIADLGVLAALIRTDKLDRKVGIDLGEAARSHEVRKVPVPKAADTQVNILNNTLASGGVMFQLMPLVVPDARETDEENSTTDFRRRPESGWLLPPEPESEGKAKESD